jgi:hypothetical protein
MEYHAKIAFENTTAFIHVQSASEMIFCQLALLLAIIDGS